MAALPPRSVALPLLAALLLTWVGITSQQRSRMVRRHHVDAIDREVRTLYEDQKRLEHLVSTAATERAKAIATRAEVLSSVLEASVLLQRTLDEQREEDAALGALYAGVHNATRRNEGLNASIAAVCPSRGGAVPDAVKQAQLALLHEQELLEHVAARYEELRRTPAPATPPPGADDSLAALAEPVPVPVTTAAPTAAPGTPSLAPATDKPRRRRKRRRQQRPADNQTAADRELHAG